MQPRSFHCWEALGIGYLIASLKQIGVECDFASGFFDSDDEIIRKSRSADIVGFGCTSPQMKHALHLASKIDKHKVFGGVHPSVIQAGTLNHCNQVVVGEGEAGVLAIAGGDKSPIVNLGNMDVERLPFPDRKAIKQERNIAQAKRETGERIGSIFASRGCAFRCTFCASKALWGRRARVRSPESVFAEFEEIVKDWQLDFVKFSDDTFTLSEKKVTAFCELKLKAKIKTPWGANIRAGTPPELLKKMKEAGCREVWIGVETGDFEILAAMKKDTTLSEIKRTFKWCDTYGIKTRAYMLIGHPMESFRSIKASEDFIDEIKPGVVGWTILAPFPGTAFYEHKYHKDVDWSRVDEYENDMTSTEWMTNKELRREQKRLVRKFSNRTYRQRSVGAKH